MYKSRKIKTFWCDPETDEVFNIEVEVTQLNVYDVDVTGTGDVPNRSLLDLEERATELYWEEERIHYLLTHPDAD